MTLVKADFSRFDPDGAADSSVNIFGMGFTADEANIVLLPVPWDATASYGKGAAKGPDAIRAASSQLDFFDADLAALGLAKPWEFGIHMEKTPAAIRELNRKATAKSTKVIAAGGDVEGKPALKRALADVNAMSRDLNSWVETRAKHWLKQGKIVGVVGGEHSVIFGLVKAVAEHCRGVGVLHIDAHADLRNSYEGFEHSHASIMHNMLTGIPGVSKLVQVGIRDFCESEFRLIKSDARVATWFDSETRARMFAGESWDRLCDAMLADLPERVYVSFDIDGLAPELCPHTGTPVPGGLTWAETMHLLKRLAASGKQVVGFDLNEVAPNPRNRADEWDGNVGARVLYRLCGVALYSQGARS